MITPQEINKLQGTRLSEKSPWETYDEEMDGEKLSPELAAQISEYETKRYVNGKVSTQTQEVLAELREVNEQTAKEYQWVTPEEYKDFDARIGVVMSHAEFITKLRKSRAKFYYIDHPQRDKLTLIWQPNGLCPLEVACWVQYGQMPELSIMNFDDYGVPLAERRRGWRTCLLQIILKGILTEEEVNKIFGNPRQDQAFYRYNSTLQSFRNLGNRL